MPKPKSMPWRLTWPLPALLVTACAQQPLQPPVEPARIPSLPAAGRVSRVQTPSECLPTCLAGLTSARASWQSMLIGSGSQEQPAKPATTR